MNKIRQKSAGKKIVMPKLRNHALLNALVAAGVISAGPVAASPLPTPCGGGACVTSAGNAPFVQAGLVDAPVYNAAGTAMFIEQHSATSILNFKDGNIDHGYSVTQNMPSTTSSSLWRIWDNNPTTISGALTSNGQIYLINQSGIIFGSGAQVNTQGLIASSLDISDSLYQAGYLTNNTNISNGQPILPAFQGTGGFIRVDTGAVLNGSKIMMFAPVVENNGRIATADGQVVLAAGNKVYLEASQDPNLRGVLVEVDVTNPGQAVSNAAGHVQNNAAGTVTNTGTGANGVLAQRGNITLVGYAVNQQGLLSATTSVTENGTIKLLARHEVNTTANAITQNQYQNVAGNTGYFDIRATQTGTVTLGKGSVTQVLPETSDNSTTTDSQGFNSSIIEAMGKTVDVQGSIIASGGRVNLVAVGSIDTHVGSIGQSGDNIYQEISPDLSYSSFVNPSYIPGFVSSNQPLTTDGARVFLDNGSLIDVSGSTTSVSVARNILDVQLRGSQLADAPMQKNGPLWGQDVYIDIRQGSTLANISGDEAQIGRTVAERTSSGGKVSIFSTGDAVLNPDSTINLSGGQVDYSGAYVNTTTLVSKGVAYNIATAPPDLVYSAFSTGGIYSVYHPKWGMTQTWTSSVGGDALGNSGTWDPGYVEGKSAGTLSILAPNAAINSNIISQTVAGIYQRQPYVDPAGVAYKDIWQNLPMGGGLVIGAASPVVNTSNNQNNFVINSDVLVQASPQKTSYALGEALPSEITLDAGLFSSGLDNLAIYTNGIAAIDAGASVVLGPGGSVVLKGGQVDMLGSIMAPGGSVDIGTVQTVNPLYNFSDLAYKNAGAVNVSGNISTRGTWVNDSSALGPPNLALPKIGNGGNISIKSTVDLNVASGVMLDVSGGGWVDQSGNIHGGNGGNISLASGAPGDTAGTNYQSILDRVILDSYGVATGKGGSLSIAASNVQIGGTATGDTLLLSPDFFQHGGFSNYSIKAQGLNGLSVADNTLVAPESRSLILDRDAALKSSGADVYAFSNPGLLPDWQRNPASITLGQTYATSGALTVGSNAEIRVDPKASITLNAANQLTVLGTLDAPAGTINLNLDSGNSAYFPMQSIWLGSDSQLLAQGYFLQSQPNSKNLVQGQVLSGGAIHISDNRGFVVAQKGSVIDVSGTSANIDLLQMVSGTQGYRTSRVAGDAGSISVETVDGAIFDGSLKGTVESGSQAGAASFSLDLSGVTNYDPVVAINFPHNVSWQINLKDSGVGGFAAIAGLTPGDNNAAGSASLAFIEGQAFLDQNSLQGFDQVTLRSFNSINLADQVNLATKRSITLDSPVISTAGNASLTSAHVTLGNLDSANQTSVAPQAGSGSLNVAAQMVDLSGKFAVSNANDVTITSSGDIRLNGVYDKSLASQDAQSLQGEMHTNGDITLQAGQVYTSTLAQFRVAVEGNPAGTITIQPDNAHAPASGSAPVLSAGGSLTLNAANIVQNGVLKAPLGSIDLIGSTGVTLAPASITSVSADGQVIPFGLVQGGNSWYYDLTGAGILAPITAPPQKKITLEGPDIAVASGATVDISGGGDLYANEFFAGTGGTINVLDPTQAPANTYAILHGLSAYSPYDPQLAGQYAQTGTNGSKTVLNSDAMVYLTGGNGLKAGYYSLLPASYALLPGAYRVTAVSGYQDMSPGQASTLANGTRIIAGKFAVAGTNIQDARWSGFAVSPGAIVRTQSEFHDSYANAFFAAQAAANGVIAPRSPLDAGQLIVSATGSGATLQLDGTFNSQPAAGGRGAWVDLSGPGFDIVNTAGSGTAGLVELTTGTLNNLGAESLLIGGVRSQDANGTTIGVAADRVQVDNSGTTLSGSEIILAANDTVAVNAGSSISGNGVSPGQAQDITIGDDNTSGNGALLRVSSGPQVTVTRNNATGNSGTLAVADGATVISQDSVLLDASKATSIGNTATLQGKSFSVAASNIDIGNGSSGTSSLSLTSALLGQMQNFRDITLHSYNDINFYGDAGLGGLNSNGNHLISNLVLNAKSLNGVNGNADSIDAATVTLANNNGDASSAMPGGSGSLSVNAGQIVLADGNSAIRGFDNVALNAAQQITGQGSGSLSVSSGNADVHSLTLAGTITGAAKSDQSIAASDYGVTINAGTGTAAAPADIGAAFAINGKSIADDGNIILPSGSVTLHATNDLSLGADSQTVASGISKVIAGQTSYAPAGTVTLTSDKGNVNITSGADVDVSGAIGGGDGGSLSVNAAQGTAAIAGNLKGSAATGYAQGSFALDTKLLAGTLTALDDQLMSGGFKQSIDMRARSGDLALDTGSTVTAQTYHLAADDGNINIFGKIDASGTTGGDILLAAANNVTLENGALLDAHATGSGNAGGDIALETIGGSVNLVNGTTIDVSGATPGSILLRAPQINGGTDVAVDTVPGTGINTSAGANVTVEAYRNYTASTISATDVTTSSAYYKDAQAFANNYAATIKTRLAVSGNNMHLLPGVQISSTGDLTLNSNWDLSTWRFNDGNGNITEPGILTLKAAGNLNFWTGTSATTANALSDGFTSATGSILLSTSSSSWSYRLVAGADAAAANVMAVSGTGNVIIAAGSDKASGAITNQKITPTPKMIRTGTGTIDIAAGGGLYLGNRDTVIYTAGQLVSGIPSNIGASTTKAFTTGGGDINIAVMGDISAVGQNGKGAATNQIITDWLWRQGSTDGTSTTPPAWWINFGSFAQNIGVLGGGNLNISAGGNITSLSAVAPTTGYVDTNAQTVTSVADPVTGKLQPLGGGNLNITAGGNIDSGMFYVGNGQGTIRAGGELGVSRSDSTGNLYTVLALGQGHYDVRTGGDLGLQTILNPTVIPQSTWQNPNTNAINYFYSYGDTSSVSLESLNGNVLFSNNISAFNSGTALAYNNSAAATVSHYTVKNIHSNADIPAMMVYPANLQVTSLNGGITINDSTSNALNLFPSANGSLQLVASSDINLLGRLVMSDASPYLYQPNLPFAQYSNIQNSFVTGHGTTTPSSLLPLHSGDNVPVVIAAGDNINGDNSSSVYPDLTLPKPVQIQAGQDIVNLSATVQNVAGDSVTSYTAGHDIAFTPYAAVPSAATVGITLSGPGQLVMQAGHNVDLGQSDGLLTNGNLANPLLPAQGAGITVLAGVASDTAGTQAFLDKYIDPSSSFAQPYGSQLISFVNGYVSSPVATVTDAYTAFNNLSPALQNTFLSQVFFGELRASGRSAISSGSGDYSAGYDAIATLFPATDYQGDVNLYYSQIKTERGGDINILTPGGGVNAGLANASSSGPQKKADKLGVVTVDGGNVNAFVNNDFLVNQSRVFTLQGGNILMWSSYGNLDAGKGSKTVSSTPPPLLVVDPKTGTFVVDATQSVVGSGIRVLLANKDVVPGTVDLFAPAGVINAGDAGIGAAGDLFIGALQVIGASNINFGGTGVGVPVANVAPVSIGGMGNVQDASKAADQATQSISTANENLASFQPSFLSVEVIGLGDEGMSLQP